MSIETLILAGTGALIIGTAAWLFWNTTHELWPRRKEKQGHR